MIRKRYDVSDEMLASMLTDEGYFNDRFYQEKKPIEVEKGFDAIKCYPEKNVAVSVCAHGDGIAEIDVYLYKGDETRHSKAGKIIDYQKYIADIEYVWVKTR